VKLNPSVRHQSFEGWGTSLCWWAHQIGAWSAAKRNEFLELILNPTTGLGYNAFRYNIGGGDDPAHDHMDQNREMPGFQSSAGAWDWNADVRQTSVLKQIAERVENPIFEAFSNSPPYFMTKSGCASGNTDGSNNLKDDSYGRFADYLTEVVKYYRDELGITFRTLEPMNEPNANWWKSKGGQEGCHFGANSQQQIIKEVAEKLTAQGLTATQISASDENSMDDAYTILSGYDSATLGYIAQLNVHSYAGSRRAELSKLATSKGKRLWQSESGPLSVSLDTNLDAALFMAGRIITDLRELKPVAWIEWQVVDPVSSWSSFSVNDSKQTWTPLKRFYSQAAFSRFIRPGASFVEIDDVNMLAALAKDGSSLTLVVRNGEKSTSKSFTFDLTTVPTLGASVEVYRTSQTEDLAKLPPIAINDYSFTASAAAYSITTYVIPLSH
jgi:O-glycosyl hydrolase